MKVLDCKKYGRCIHIYDEETDGPACHSRIKREDWEIIEMPLHIWRGEEWRCWACAVPQGNDDEILTLAI